MTGEKRARREASGRNCYFSERVYGRFRRTFRINEGLFVSLALVLAYIVVFSIPAG